MRFSLFSAHLAFAEVTSTVNIDYACPTGFNIQPYKEKHSSDSVAFLSGSRVEPEF